MFLVLCILLIHSAPAHSFCPYRLCVFTELPFMCVYWIWTPFNVPIYPLRVSLNSIRSSARTVYVVCWVAFLLVSCSHYALSVRRVYVLNKTKFHVLMLLFALWQRYTTIVRICKLSEQCIVNCKVSWLFDSANVVERLTLSCLPRTTAIVKNRPEAPTQKMAVRSVEELFVFFHIIF
jgi:hypothetical protein